MSVSIAGIPRGKVLAALYNNSRPLGMGFLHARGERMTEAQADEILKSQTKFDCLMGRVMKVDLSGDSFDEWLYDRDFGYGAASRVIERLEEELESDRQAGVDVPR